MNNQTPVEEWDYFYEAVAAEQQEAGEIGLGNIADLHIERLEFLRQKDREELRGKIEKLFCYWGERTEGRDNSQDDSFDDGQELMKQKVLSLLDSQYGE